MNRFLLAKFHFDSIQSKSTITDIRKTLAALPRGSQKLNSAYDEIMLRINQQDEDNRALAKMVLSWAAFAYEPLTKSELLTAVALMKDPTLQDISEEDLVDEALLTSVCAGLVVIDADSAVVRLVHYTTQDYLKSIKEQWFPDVEFHLARTCLNYLLTNMCIDFSKEKKLTSLRITRISKGENVAFPFALHSARRWGRYAAGYQSCPDIQTLALCYLHDTKRLKPPVEITGGINDDGRYEWEDQKPMLQLAAFDLCELAYIYVDVQHSLDILSSPNLLHTAVYCTNARFVAFLLDHPSVDVNEQTTHGYTPLHLAVDQGLLDVSAELLRRDDIDLSIEFCGRTVLDQAIVLGHPEIAVMLCQHKNYQGPDQPTWQDVQLLAIAAQGDLDKFNMALIACVRDGRDLNTRDFQGRSVLHYAAFHEHKTLVDALLAYPGINLNTADKYGNTALLTAIACGKVVVAMGLLGYPGIEVNCKNANGEAPLLIAVERPMHREAMVKSLLAHPDIDVNIRGTNGLTALHVAIMRDCSDVIAQLMAHPRINVQIQDV